MLGEPFVRAAVAAVGVVVAVPSLWGVVSAAVASAAELVASMAMSTS